MTTPAMPLVLGAMGVGTGIQILGGLQQGKETQDIDNRRAAIDIANADAVRRTTEVKAGIMGEQGAELLAKQKSIYAAMGVLSNIGSPLVVAAKTAAALAKDIGFTLEAGRIESDSLRSQAGYEKAMGKVAIKKSVWDAVTTGLEGFGSMAYLGYKSGTWK